MAKRKGMKPLNLDCSDDSEPEEPGSPVRASEAELKNRVVKVARRRLTKQPPAGGVFGSLSAAACLKSQPQINLESTFAFLKKGGTGTLAPVSGIGAFNALNGNSSSNAEKSIQSSKSSTPLPKTDSSSKMARTDIVEPSLKRDNNQPPVKSNQSVSANGDEKVSSSVDVKDLCAKDSTNPILEQVKILNIECLQWAQQHIDEDPMSDLRPVFKDYNQYFESILQEYHKAEGSKPKESNASSETLAKLQNHIKTKNQAENNKDSDKTEGSSSSNNFYSPDSNAEIKSKISQSLNRLSYFSSLLDKNNSSSETNSDSIPTPQVSSPSIQKAPDATPKLSNPISSPKSESNKKVEFSFGRPSSDSPKPPTFPISSPKSDSTPKVDFSFRRPSSDSPKLSNFADSADKSATSETAGGSFLKMPAVANNCFSNPQPQSFTNSNLFAKDSADSKSKFGSIFGNTAPTPSIFGSTPSPFGSSNTTAEALQKDEEGDDDDQPRVVEVKPMIEEGAKYTTRCKVFIKKEDNSYGDKGVGTLSLKGLENSNKSQLVVRAESTLGNILVNVLLSKDLPIQRTGKNNVLIVCLPTPDCEPPPKVVLLRVKTEDDADKLCEVLKNAQA
nr:PREDICTED: nuclear pore complex protein Nup50 [Bemisia tabaci]